MIKCRQRVSRTETVKEERCKNIEKGGRGGDGEGD